MIKSVTLPTTSFALKQNEDRADELAKIRRGEDVESSARKTPDFLVKFTQARKYQGQNYKCRKLISVQNTIIQTSWIRVKSLPLATA
jgi:hypothetical protein